MKSHSLPSLLGIAAVLIAALVVAIAFGVSTDSPTAQAQAADDDPNLINITTADQLDAVRYDEDGDGEAENAGTETEMYEAAFPEADRACATATPNACEGYELMADVDLEGRDWEPIGFYMGAFDGNGHIIANMTIDTDSVLNVGLFSELDGAAAVRNLGLTGVSVTVTNHTVASVSVGGLAGMNAGAVSNSYARGQIIVTRGQAFSASNAGGLVGGNTGAITASYASVDVTASMGAPIAGGLVGVDNSPGNISASYATGDAAAAASEGSNAIAGGLVGTSGGTILASYATGYATATASGSGNATAGGLVGSGSVTITASYSTGGVSANVDTGTATTGGLVGGGNPNVMDGYWDTDSSGIPATTTAAGMGTSTLMLQAPTGYGTTTDIFGTWNLDIDGDASSTPDDPWDFGGNWQYPVLKYGGLAPVMQRPQVKLVLSGTSTLEDESVTITAKLYSAAKQDTVVEITVSDGASADSTTLTIPAGATVSNEVTITPADNSGLGENDDVTISGQVQPGGSGADNPADVTLEIGDDEALEPVVVENVRVRTRETLAVVTWDALDGATGYTVEWTSRVSRGVASWGRVSSMDVDGTSATVRRLVPGTDYGFRVSASNIDGSTSSDVVAATEGEDDGASPFATMTPTPTPTPVATPIPPTTQVGTSTATTLTSDDGHVTLELPAGSRSEPYQVNFETATGCSYAGAKADVSFTCVSALIFDSEDMLETDVEFDAAPTIAFHLTAEQVEALGGEFLLTKLHEMGGLMIVTRASADDAWTALAGTTLTFDDESGGAVLAGWPASVTSFTAVAVEATYDTIQDTYGHLLPRDTLTPPTGGPSVPGMALLALLLGSVALLAAGWVMTARRSGV